LAFTLSLFLIRLLVFSGAIYLGMMIMNVAGSFGISILIAFLSSLFSALVPLGLFLPGGHLLGLIIVMAVLLNMMTDADFWPDALVISLIALIAGTVAQTVLSLLFLGSLAAGLWR
jgi:hypothetical protein